MLKPKNELHTMISNSMQVWVELMKELGGTNDNEKKLLPHISRSIWEHSYRGKGMQEGYEDFHHHIAKAFARAWQLSQNYSRNPSHLAQTQLKTVIQELSLALVRQAYPVTYQHAS